MHIKTNNIVASPATAYRGVLEGVGVPLALPVMDAVTLGVWVPVPLRLLDGVLVCVGLTLTPPLREEEGEAVLEGDPVDVRLPVGVVLRVGVALAMNRGAST